MSAWDDICGERELLAIRTDVVHPFESEANGVALDLGDMTVLVFEDPADGYRSCAAEPFVAKCSLYQLGCNPEYLRVPVLIRRWVKSATYSGEADGVEFIDRRNGKTILLLGTDNSDDYYPIFTCDWRPQDIADNAQTEFAATPIPDASTQKEHP